MSDSAISSRFNLFEGFSDAFYLGPSLWPAQRGRIGHNSQIKVFNKRFDLLMRVADKKFAHDSRNRMRYYDKG